LLGFHAYRQIAAGAGAGRGDQTKRDAAVVRAHLAAIGQRLGWPGALSVDYILPDDDATPLLID